MQASVVGLNAVRDLVARAAWAMPHDARRDLYRRLRPGSAELHDDMRAHRLGELDGLTVSLRPAEQRGAIFVDVPKTGGLVIGGALFDGYTTNHMPVGTYQLIYDRADFDRLFRFGFVRNPYDRLSTSYEFVAQGERVRDAAGPADSRRKPAPEAAVGAFEDFEHFVLGWLTPRNARSLEQFRPQHRFLDDPAGRNQVQMVGRSERLAEDVTRVAERLGVTPELPAAGAPAGTNSHADRFTPAMRRVVESVYGEDLRRFDYTYGG